MVIWYKIMSKQTSSDACLICGDVAQGYNFYTLSCHSCKAFFRRNLKQEHKDSDKYKELKMRKISLNHNTTDIQQGYKSNISKITLTTCMADSTTQNHHNINNKTICINTCVTVIDGNDEVPTFIPRPITDYLNTFNEREANKLNELMSATVVFTDNLDGTKTKPFTRQEFNRYMVRKEDGNTKVVSIESTKLLPNNAYIFYRQFFNDISQEWESDPIILDLLTAIILFNPDRPKLISTTHIPDPGNHVHFIITHVGGHKCHQPFGQPVIGVNPILLARIGGQVWPRDGNGVLNK
ncbi:unnamed protein product [Medioppia subpectinata]|uniref:Nuclear receptor domain-containing protein n=1 Tax=Medioppia subpectinata TaxID=1979941 RepID=A0A7R9PVF3_9ACAR|nr:unnamed protein product [Medioppia subpectinata]CAG2102233.1 unnamed protein product [Medioppia subpectinata]